MNKLPKRIFKCTKCGRYTLRRDRCPHCNGLVMSAHPPRWSPFDKFVNYRVSHKKLIKKIVSNQDALGVSNE